MAKSWGMSVTGLRSTKRMLERLRFEFDEKGVFIVGPTVKYAVHVDQGTSRMAARPFAKPAAERVQRDLTGAMNRYLDESLVEAGEAEIVHAVAVAVQAEMQRIITEKRAVDTGAMRASVTIERVR